MTLPRPARRPSTPRSPTSHLRPLLERLEDRTAPAVAGSLDATFGGGTVTTDLSHAPDSASAVALQPNGKVVVAGASGGLFLVARYNADGTLDHSFHSTGTVVTTFD